MAETIALVGGETLLGMEVRNVLGETSLGQHLRLVAGDADNVGKITVIGEDPAFIGKLDPEELADAEVVILAGPPASSRDALATNPSGLIVDLVSATEENPEARLRAPQVESSDYEPDHTGPQIVAHPAAVAIALVLTRLNRAFPVTRSIVHIFEPASERGKKGMEELQLQTSALLNLQPVPKDVYGTQVSFNMLARLEGEASPSLQDVEERIERHLATLLDRDEGIPMPSIRVAQAPVFHGYTLSMWVEFDEAPSAMEIEEALIGEWVDIRSGELEPPNNVDVAGLSGIAVGGISSDRNDGNAAWIWIAADNLRVAAESATLIVREVI